jgi:hypothetical protein
MANNMELDITLTTMVNKNKVNGSKEKESNGLNDMN